MNLLKILRLLRLLPAIVLLLGIVIVIGGLFLKTAIQTYFPSGLVKMPKLTLPNDSPQFVMKDAHFVRFEPVNRVRFGFLGKDKVVVSILNTRPSSPMPSMPKTRVYLKDESGRVYQDYAGSDSESTYAALEGPLMPDLGQGNPTGQIELARFQIDTKQIPLQAGRITFHGEIFMQGDKPLIVDVVVREHKDWYRPHSATIALKSWKLARESDSLVVKLVLAYRGRKSLSTTIPTPSMISKGDSLYWGSGFLMGGTTSVALPTNQLRLVTHWSQRLEGTKGQSFWIEPKSREFRAEVLSSKYDAKIKQCNVSYRLNIDNLPQKLPFTFAAEIGVENDGFLPVKIPIRDTSGKWLIN